MVVFLVVFGHRHVTLATTLDNLKFLVDVKDEEDMHHVRFPKIYHNLIVSKMFFIASTLYNSVFTGTGVRGSACDFFFNFNTFCKLILNLTLFVFYFQI